MVLRFLNHRRGPLLRGGSKPVCDLIVIVTQDWAVSIACLANLKRPADKCNTDPMDLSRFSSGLFRVVIAMKETTIGTKIQRRVQTSCGSHCNKQLADATTDRVRFRGWCFDTE